MGKAARKKHKLERALAKEFAGEFEKTAKEFEKEWLATLSQDYGYNLDNLQNYTYEEFLSQIPANPTVLSHLTEENFKMAQKEFPYFGVDKNGELHFHSLPKINFQKQVLRKISESLY